MQVLNMSSFLKCLHNTDIPNGFLNFLTPRKELKKVAIYLGLPGLFDDDFEYIVRRSKFMVKQCFNPQHTSLHNNLELRSAVYHRLFADSCCMSSSRTHCWKIMWARRRGKPWILARFQFISERPTSPTFCPMGHLSICGTTPLLRVRMMSSPQS